MNICVIGTGYVGLVAGSCLAESGNDVTCADSDESKIAMLNEGQLPIYEPRLPEIVERNTRGGRLRFTTELEPAVAEAEVVFIAVGTPPGDDGRADLSAVFAVAETVGKNIKGYTVVVDKSTVPVGTAERVEAIIREQTDEPFDVVSNPEFMKEGAAVEDFMKPDRVIIGAKSEKAAKLMTELYEPYVRNENPILIMDPRSAEMTKYAANAMLATKVSFINEIANICERLGADINHVRRGMGFDQRIGFKFLFPGVGYGGSCFPKDVQALIRSGAEVDYTSRILNAVEQVNLDQKRSLVEKVISHFNGKFSDPLAIWGLSFKPATDDIREAPALTIIDGLLEAGAELRVYDPVALEAVREVYGDKLMCCDTRYEPLGGCGGLVIVTEWNEFRGPDFGKMHQLMKRPVIFDGRNLYEPENMAERGFAYYSVGRQPAGLHHDDRK